MGLDWRQKQKSGKALSFPLFSFLDAICKVEGNIMANSGAMVLGIMLIGVVVVALLFGSQIVGFVSGLPDRFEDWINSIRGTLPGAGGDVEGQTWIGYTIFYVDGSSEEFYESAPSFSIFPLSITHQHGIVSSVTVNLKAQLYGEGLSGCSGLVSMKTELYKTGTSAPKTSATANYTVQQSSWADGAVKVLASYSISEAEMEDIARVYGQGEYSLQFTGSVKLTVTSEGVPVELTGASPAGTLRFLFLNYDPPTFSITGGAVNFGVEDD